MSNCPTCGAPLDLANLLDGSAHSQRVAAGVDSEAWFWTFRLWCPECRSVIELIGTMGKDEVRAVPGEEALAALTRRLETARGKGTLRGALLSVLRSEQAHLLAVPELRPTVREGFGEHMVLARDLWVESAPDRDIAARFVAEVQPPARLRPLGRLRLPEAEVVRPPGGAPGGLLRAVDDPLRIQPDGGWLPPLRPPRPAFLLAGTRLQLRGTWGPTLRFRAPGWTRLPFELSAPPQLVRTWKAPDDQ